MVLLWKSGYLSVHTEVHRGGANPPGDYIYQGSIMTAEELDFCKRIQEYKHRTGVAMPPCDALLAMVSEMGYSRNPPMTPRDLSQLIAKETYRARCVKKRRGYFLVCSEILALIVGQGYTKSESAVQS